MKHTQPQNTHYVIMFIIMVLSGLLSTMNVWVDKADEMGMIPHHSMAVHMSKKLLEKENNISRFVKDIIKKQENEIIILKK